MPRVRVTSSYGSRGGRGSPLAIRATRPPRRAAEDAHIVLGGSTRGSRRADRQRRFSTAAIASFVTYPDARTARGRDVRETSTERLLRIDRFAARGDPPPPAPCRARVLARATRVKLFRTGNGPCLRRSLVGRFFFCGALACSGAINFGHGTWERKKLLITFTFYLLLLLAY